MKMAWPDDPPRADGTAVELCCGMGGIGIGLAAAGYRVVKAYDSWPDAVAIYNHNAPEQVAKCCDILSAEGRATIRKERRGLDVDLLAAGPPCKGFSQIRNDHHDQQNPHNQVLSAMPEYVAIYRPRLVLIENVPDLARHQHGETLRGLLEELERPGPRGLRYRVEYGVYDAALYGTPQARRRILILAVRRGSGEERLPEDSPVHVSPAHVSQGSTHYTCRRTSFLYTPSAHWLNFIEYELKQSGRHRPPRGGGTGSCLDAEGTLSRRVSQCAKRAFDVWYASNRCSSR
jgi:DNA-cytosine methyltransferase